MVTCQPPRRMPMHTGMHHGAWCVIVTTGDRGHPPRMDFRTSRTMQGGILACFLKFMEHSLISRPSFLVSPFPSRLFALLSHYRRARAFSVVQTKRSPSTHTNGTLHQYSRLHARRELIKISLLAPAQKIKTPRRRERAALSSFIVSTVSNWPSGSS